MPVWLTLETWAAATFEVPPKMATLRAWAAAGAMRPPAQKIGKRWMVPEYAEYVGCQNNAEVYSTPMGVSTRALKILQGGRP